MAGGTRAQKPVGSTAWIAAEKENVLELVDQEMEEAEYPVRHEMAWLNEHMTDIFSKGQANFTDVFKTPGKMRGKTPRTARKRNVEENRVPLSEIFSSAQKQGDKRVSPSPFIHRVVSKVNATTAASASPRPKNTDNVPQPQYPDLTQNLNSFSKYNADSGYHGMENDNDDMVLPDTQPDTQASTQPLEANEPMAQSSQGDISMSQQTADDSFHSAQENVRARGETVEPMNIDPTPTQERTPRPAEQTHEEPQSNSTPKAKTEAKAKASGASPKKQQEPETQHGPEQEDDEPASPSKSSPKKHPLSQPSKTQESEKQDVEMEEVVKEDTVLDTFDDIGSPSDGSTPERPLVRKSSLTFASLPAREPLTKSRISRTSHIDLPKLNNPSRPSYLGRQTGSQKPSQPVEDDSGDESNAMDVDDKGPAEDTHMDQASKLHNTKSTQSLHERISMLGKLQPSRPKKSIAAAAGSSAGQVAYPDLPSSKPETKPDSSSQKTRGTPAPEPEPTSNDDDDWIKPLSSPNRPPNLSRSKTTDVMEKLFDTEKDQSAANKDTPAAQEQQSVEPERPKTSTSIFSSPRPKGHQQTASASNITGEASTTPTGSPRRYDGPLSASKMRLQSIMKSAKGLLTSSGSSARKEPSSPTQQPTQSQERASIDIDDKEEQESQPQQIPSLPRQEARRTRSSTEKEEKQRQREQEDRQQKEARQEEVRQEKAREQEKQRALQLKAAQEKSSVEPEDRAGPKQPQHQRQQSREPESIHEASKSAAHSKQNDRRPKPPTRELPKPRPQPVSIRVGSTLPRQMPMASSVSSNVQETNVSAPPQPSAPASKTSSLKKKGSNQSLQTASSTSSFKSSVSTQQTQAQRKAQLASEKKKEQEERESRRKEEQKREQERKRAAQQQQDEARRQEMRSRAEAADRERRERSAQEDPKKAAHMQAIEKRRLENARRHERQGSQQATSEAPMMQHEKQTSQSSSQWNEGGTSRPASRLGSIQPYGRPINPPVPNPAKPPKRVMDEEAGFRPAVKKPSNVLPTGEGKRQKTEDEPPVRPPMAPPIRHSNIRKPSAYGQSSMAHPSSSSSIFKTAQPQRPAHPMDMAKYTNGKIPFAESSHAPPPAAHKPAAPSSSQRAPAPPKPSPKYPTGESVHLPEIATDSEDEDDSDSEMFPVPKWAQPKELEGLLRQQDGMEVDSIFGPIAPFSLEETFKADKKIKKYRDRTSSANWSGPDGLTQDEIRKDVADRQRMRLNGGWSFT